MESQQVTFSQFDNVRVVDNEHTRLADIANKDGVVHGFTTPSVTGIACVGPLQEDFAWNVYIQSLDEDFWLDPSMIAFVSRPESITIRVGDETMTFESNMEIEYVEPRKPWWQFWR